MTALYEMASIKTAGALCRRQGLFWITLATLLGGLEAQAAPGEVWIKYQGTGAGSQGAGTPNDPYRVNATWPFDRHMLVLTRRTSEAKVIHLLPKALLRRIRPMPTGSPAATTALRGCSIRISASSAAAGERRFWILLRPPASPWLCEALGT